MKNLLRVIALFATICASACDGSSDLDSSHNQISKRDSKDTKNVELLDSRLAFNEVKSKLAAQDAKEMADAIVQMVTMRDRADVAALLMDAWTTQENNHPDLNWSVLKSNRVRIALAQVLGQWHPDDPQFRTFILQTIDQSDGSAKSDALIALGVVANHSDIAYLEKVARSDDDFVVAAGALAALQISGAESAVSVLRRIAEDEDLQEQRRDLASSLLTMPRPGNGTHQPR